MAYIFLTEADFDATNKATIRDIVKNSDNAIIETAERVAVEVVQNYLNPIYDNAAIFGQVGNNRNQLIVRITKDICLYEIYSRLPNRQMPQVIVDRYEEAMRALERIQNGRLNPILPRINTETGNSGAVAWGSSTKRTTKY